MSKSLIIFTFLVSFLVACQKQEAYELYRNSLAIYQSDSLLCASEAGKFFAEFESFYQNLIPAHQSVFEPRSKDWLALHEEQGQHFFQYAAQFPQQQRVQDSLFFIQIGDFTPNQAQLFREITTYIACFYQAPIAVLPAISLANIDNTAKRLGEKEHELDATYLTNTILPQYLPQQAMGVIGITAHNLYPNRALPYVFGQASASKKTAVVSLYQLGKLMGTQAKRRVKNRALKLVSHEIGHVFGFAHCIAFSCVMNGSNHLEELDTKPHWLCPDCLSKLHWYSGRVTQQRFDELAAYWKLENSYRTKHYDHFSTLIPNTFRENQEKMAVE